MWTIPVTPLTASSNAWSCGCEGPQEPHQLETSMKILQDTHGSNVLDQDVLKVLDFGGELLLKGPHEGISLLLIAYDAADRVSAL